MTPVKDNSLVANTNGISKDKLPQSVKSKPIFQLSRMVERMKTSATLEMSTIVRIFRSQGFDISNFGLGQSPFGAPDVVRNALIDNAYRTDYLPTEGIFDLRKNICDFYSRHFSLDVNPDQIVIGPGSKQLIYNTMQALNSPWMFISPSWVSYETQAKLAQEKSWRAFISYKDEFRTSVSSIRKKFNEIEDKLEGRTLSILINYPNNPTGLTLSKNEIRKIARFARNNEIIILSDEIYGNITHPSFGQEHYSIAHEYPEGTIVTGGISKDRSMGGYRFGVAIFPEEETQLVKAMKAIGSETYSAVAAPIQYAALTAYDRLPEIDQYIQRSTEIHELIGNYVYNKLKEANYEVAKPEGAFYLLPSVNHKIDNILDKGIYTSKDLVEHMIMNYGVAAIAGTAFGLNSEDLSFRLAYIDYDGKEVMKEYTKDIDAARNDPELFVEKYAPRIKTGTERLQEVAYNLFE